jgi:hypothetical protein
VFVFPLHLSLVASPFTEEQVSELFATLDLVEAVEAERDVWRQDPSPATQCNYASTLVCTFGPFEQEMGIDLLLGVSPLLIVIAPCLHYSRYYSDDVVSFLCLISLWRCAVRQVEPEGGRQKDVESPVSRLLPPEELRGRLAVLLAMLGKGIALASYAFLLLTASFRVIRWRNLSTTSFRSNSWRVAWYFPFLRVFCALHLF